MSESESDGQTTLMSLKQDFDGLRQMVQRQNQMIMDLQEELEEERKKRKELEKEIDQQTDSNELVQQIRQNGSGTWDGYAAILVETLARKAGEDGVATMDASGCRDALQGQPHRTNTYDIMRHTADVVDSDMVRFVDEPRNSKRNSRLKMDRSIDDLPRRVAGTSLEVSN